MFVFAMLAIIPFAYGEDHIRIASSVKVLSLNEIRKDYVDDPLDASSTITAAPNDIDDAADVPAETAEEGPDDAASAKGQTVTYADATRHFKDTSLEFSNTLKDLFIGLAHNKGTEEKINKGMNFLAHAFKDFAEQALPVIFNQSDLGKAKEKMVQDLSVLAKQIENGVSSLMGQPIRHVHTTTTTQTATTNQTAMSNTTTQPPPQSLNEKSAPGDMHESIVTADSMAETEPNEVPVAEPAGSENQAENDQSAGIENQADDGQSAGNVEEAQGDQSNGDEEQGVQSSEETQHGVQRKKRVDPMDKISNRLKSALHDYSEKIGSTLLDHMRFLQTAFSTFIETLKTAQKCEPNESLCKTSQEYKEKVKQALMDFHNRLYSRVKQMRERAAKTKK